MKKNEARKHAEQVFLEEEGRITNKELAEEMDIHPATIARWRKEDEWDRKLVQAVTTPEFEEMLENDPFEEDMEHLQALNDRISSCLKKPELLPGEILQLAEAKFHLMQCSEIIRDNARMALTELLARAGVDME